MEIYDNILSHIAHTLIGVCIITLVVLVAMAIDFFSGWYKAKLRGEATRSRAMRKSVPKFINYEGAVMIAGCIDVLISFLNLYEAVNMPFLDGVPTVSVVIGILLCTVELISVREKAEQKQKEKIHEAVEVLTNIIGKSDIKRAIAENMRKEAQDGDKG